METELTAEDRELLQRLEEELWREETRFDLSRMEEVIAEDFFEFGRSTYHGTQLGFIHHKARWH